MNLQVNDANKCKMPATAEQYSVITTYSLATDSACMLSVCTGYVHVHVGNLCIFAIIDIHYPQNTLYFSYLHLVS